MKINWGTGITIALVLFGGFIITLIVKTTQVKDDLVAEDYYDQTLTYQREIDQKHEAEKLGSSLRFETNDKHILFTLPKVLNNRNLNGEVHFLRPNNSTFDKTHKLAPQDTNVIVVPRGDMLAGKWVVKVYIEDADQEYLWETDMHLK